MIQILISLFVDFNAGNIKAEMGDRRTSLELGDAMIILDEG